MEKKLKDIVDFIGGSIEGNSDVVITGVSGVKEAQEGDITFLANSKYSSLAKTTKASAIICPMDTEECGITLVRVENPSVAFSKALSLFVDDSGLEFKGVHETAVVSKDALLGENVNIGPHVIIEGKVAIGEGTTIHGGSFVGYRTNIGKDCLIYPNVSIMNGANIGDRVVIHSSSVIGSDGFGFVNVEGAHHKIPQIGIVEIDDDVEIGANVSIDRARFAKTKIGQGTKIDNLVQIAHNVQIGKNCIIVAHVGISGSTTIEDNVILAGQVGVAGHITVGKGIIVGAQSGVTHSIIEGEGMYWGTPS